MTKENKYFLAKIFTKKKELDDWIDILNNKKECDLTENHINLINQHFKLTEVLESSLKMLNEDEKMLIRAIYIERMSNVELADTLGMSQSTASRRRKNASNKLAQYIHDYIGLSV